MGIKTLRDDSLSLTILSILAAGSVILAVAAIPEAVIALGLILKMQGRKPRERSLEQALRRLHKRRLVQLVAKNGKDILQLTENGKQRLRMFDFGTLKLSLPARWDHQWTVILFDIPEFRKAARDALRRKLQELGCYPYHKSVFVHPTDCRDEIDYITEFFQIGRYVIHFRTAELGKDEVRARRHFKLS